MDVVAFKPSSRTFQLQLSCWSSCSCDTKIIGGYHWASPSRDRRNGEVICKSRHRRSNSKFMLPLSFEVETFRIRGFCAVLDLDFFVLSSAQTSFALFLRFCASTSKRSEVETECSEVFDAGTRMRKVLGCRVSLSPEAREEQRADREPIFERNTGRPQSAISPIQRIKCQFFKKIDPNWFVCVVFRGKLHLKLEVLGCIEEAVCICDLWEVCRWSQAAQDLGKICFRHVFETEDEDQGRRGGRNGEHVLRWFYASWTTQTFLFVSGEGKAPAAQMVWGLPKWVAQVLNDHWKMSSRQDPFLKCFYGCACVGALMYQFLKCHLQRRLVGHIWAFHMIPRYWLLWLCSGFAYCCLPYCGNSELVGCIRLDANLEATRLPLPCFEFFKISEIFSLKQECRQYSSSKNSEGEFQQLRTLPGSPPFKRFDVRGNKGPKIQPVTESQDRWLGYSPKGGQLATLSSLESLGVDLSVSMFS